MKSILVTILLTVGLFSQSPSELRAIDEKGFDIFGEMKDQSQMLKTGMARGGIVLSQEQLLEVVQARNYNAQRIINLLGGEIQTIEVVTEVNPQVFVLLESLLTTDEGVVFYYKNKARSEQRVREAIELLRPTEE